MGSVINSKSVKINFKSFLYILLAIFIVIAGIILVYTIYFKNSVSNIYLFKEKQSKWINDPVVAQFPYAQLLNYNFFALEKKGDTTYTNYVASETIPSDIPEVPSDVKVVDLTTGNVAMIFWKQSLSSSADFVRIYQYDNSTGASFLLADNLSAAGYYLFNNLDNNKIYQYQLVSVNKTEAAEQIESVNNPIHTVIATDQQAPASPTNLSIAKNDNQQLELAWVNPTDEDFNLIHVYRFTKNNTKNLELVAELDKNATSFQDQNYQDNIATFYVVTALDISNNESSKQILVNEDGNNNPFQKHAQ